MSRTTFTGPVRSGPILNTTGTIVGKDVANVGVLSASQSDVITQAGSVVADPTNIVIPAGSRILSIILTVTAAWTGAATTFSLGTNATATNLGDATVPANTAPAVGIVLAGPGPSAAAVGLWQDVGTTDVRIFFKSTNTGTGAANLTVIYAQG